MNRVAYYISRVVDGESVRQAAEDLLQEQILHTKAREGNIPVHQSYTILKKTDPKYRTVPIGQDVGLVNPRPELQAQYQKMLNMQRDQRLQQLAQTGGVLPQQGGTAQQGGVTGEED